MHIHFMFSLQVNITIDMKMELDSGMAIPNIYQYGALFQRNLILPFNTGLEMEALYSLLETNTISMMMISMR